ncbi:PTS sugar transporter subunit IIA [Wukongibacter baidiensis]|uniref:PTS sugar transporter subunit IIA n=1 Tax=Wukongibacter baidiensis TaxID=1723361 RepID=UPI003D7FB2F9
MLKDLFLNNDLVLCNYDAKDWKDAVTKSINLLEENGFTEKDTYLESVFSNTEKNGPYYVISPGVAIPHARPEDGVKDLALSIITLKTPIEFNHEANDPVEIIIGLAAKDGASHLELMQQVGKILFEEVNIEAIRKANSNEELKNCLLDML